MASKMEHGFYDSVDQLTLVGQALLSRHEAYMAEAERDRMQLNARIERLEQDKEELEAQNAIKIQDNNELAEQLDLLNHTVSEADAKIRSLEATLLSSQQAIRHLEGTAARAAHAERHLKELEEEQERLHGELRSSREEARSHAFRFKEAQRGILDMQDQLDRMEKEARQERERHAETMEKIERQREVEKQLDAAALRLKGAAASKTIKEQKQGSNKTVGNFVRDLLQDNANLQLAIAELREMLFNSNDEIQSLREQLMFHQPMPPTEGTSPASTLKAELEPLLNSQRVSQEMHVHHHYHISSKQDGRRPKRKRQGLLPGVFPSSSHQPGTSTPGSDRWRSVSSPAGSTSQPSDDATPTMPIPSGNWNGYSTSSSAVSSVVGSPQSSSRGYFDHAIPEADPLVSPSTSYDPISPTWRAAHKKRISEASSSSFQSLSVVEGESGVMIAHQSHHRWASTTIREEDEEDQYADTHMSMHQTRSKTGMTIAEEMDHAQSEEDVPSPKLRRVISHESIMSLSGGLDIHTLMSRPNQMTLRPLGGADAIVTGVNAQPTLSRTYSTRGDAALRNHFASFQTSRLSTGSTAGDLDSSSQTSRESSGSLGRWVGWRPWGVGSTTPIKPTANEGDFDPKRAPGINQPGTVPGFARYWVSQKRKGAPARVTTETIDREALTESLREAGVSE
ncbi:hypothetical protein PT974_03149 [Cladobotryum mycophilum]|uniref:Uncharacterized protein n=1 Tax=Cladobotryum mycophilum TaxID=491253 RepID=A0ABR0SRH0_9HYPO